MKLFLKKINYLVIITLFLSVTGLIGCAGAKKEIKTASYYPYTKTTRATHKATRSTVNVTRTKNRFSSNSNVYKTVVQKLDNKIEKTEHKKNIAMKEEIKDLSNDLQLIEDRYIVLNNISNYFGDRKFKSLVYAVGDFNNWGKNGTTKFPLSVKNDQIKLDLYSLPLLKGSNRIGFADFSGNIWNVKEGLHKNKLITQSTDGQWVIGVIVTNKGSITFYKNGNKQKLITKR